MQKYHILPNTKPILGKMWLKNTDFTKYKTYSYVNHEKSRKNFTRIASRYRLSKKTDLFLQKKPSLTTARAFFEADTVIFFRLLLRRATFLALFVQGFLCVRATYTSRWRE